MIYSCLDFIKFQCLLLGTVQCLFYNMAGADRNGVTTIFDFVQSWVNTFIKVLAFYKFKMKFEDKTRNAW